jgi:hypothetical protein
MLKLLIQMILKNLQIILFFPQCNLRMQFQISAGQLTESEQSTFNATKHENAGKIRQWKIFSRA